MDTLFWLSLSPIILILVLLLLFRMKLVWASLITFGMTTVLVFFNWQIYPTVYVSSVLKGLFVGIDIALIIAGALYFMQFFTQTKRLDTFKHTLSLIHTDVRIQTIFLAMFFVAFIEGTAGFGTPAAVVVPLLVAFGIPAVYAVAIALMGDSIPVMFGAVSTPILVGFDGLSFTSAGLASLFVVPLLILLPLLMLAYIKHSGLKLPTMSLPYWKLIPFALWASVCYIVPFVFFGYFAHEVASLFGSLIGMVILGITTYFGWFIPAHHSEQSTDKVEPFEAFNAIFPYLLFILLLFTGKIITLVYSLDLGNGLRHTLNFHNPGVLFFVTILLTSLILPRTWSAGKTFLSVSKKLLYPFVAILCLGALVQLFVYSSFNSSGYESMIVLMAQALQNEYLYLFSPLVGILGAFVSGSATVSNLLFANLQVNAAQTLGLSVSVVLVLQLIGGAIGNMIALTNIVAAQSVVGLVGQERHILKLTIGPCLLFGLIVGAIAWFFF